MKSKFILIAIVFLTYLLSTCSPDREILVDTSKVYNYTTIENNVSTLINDYRVSRGKSFLKTNYYMSYESRGHNDYMIENRVVNHDYFQSRADALVSNLDASRVGEIIAYNYQSAESVVLAWKNSPSHDQIMLGDYTHFGISVKIDSLTGKKYYTNLFMKTENNSN